MSHGGALDLVPRLETGGYSTAEVEERRRWVEAKTGARLDLVGAYAFPSDEMRGNVENPVGAVQVPLGVAGPLLVHGEHARGTFYVPMATTEGTLVRSYERGMVALTRAGGAVVRLDVDENRVSPVFVLPGVAEAVEFAAEVGRRFEPLRAEAEATTRHGRLLRIVPRPIGRAVTVDFCYATGDAHGMNMIALATDRACRWIVEQGLASGYTLMSGMESEKRASGTLLAGGKGKRVVAGARLPARVVRSYLHSTPEELCELWRRTALGHLQAGALGYNGQIANGLTALYIACGQDVANVANAAVGITTFEATPEGDLYATVTLPSLLAATVGGGTALGTARECLAMLGCSGDDAEGGAAKLAEIAAATVLAGELSMGGAIASGEFVAAHETYGRNRPSAGGDGGPAGEAT